MLDPYKRRIMKMPDGGSVALDFEDLETNQDLPSDAPVVILLPGENSISRRIMTTMAESASTRCPLTRNCYDL